MALGFISAFSETLALAVVVSKGIPPLINAVVVEPEDHIKAASAWSLGQIGRHSPDHAKALADANALPKLLAVYLHEASSEDLKTKSKRALKSVIQKCAATPAHSLSLSRPKGHGRSAGASTYLPSSLCCTTRPKPSSLTSSISSQRLLTRPIPLSNPPPPPLPLLRPPPPPPPLVALLPLPGVQACSSLLVDNQV